MLSPQKFEILKVFLQQYIRDDELKVLDPQQYQNLQTFIFNESPIPDEASKLTTSEFLFCIMLNLFLKPKLGGSGTEEHSLRKFKSHTNILESRYSPNKLKSAFSNYTKLTSIPWEKRTNDIDERQGLFTQMKDTTDK